MSLSDPAPAGGVSVLWSAVPGGSAAASDLVSVMNQQLDFVQGEISKSIGVNVVGDTFLERNETFQVILTSPTNAVLYDNLGQGTIVDEDVEAIYTTSAGPLDLSWNGVGYSHLRRATSYGDRAAGMAMDPDGRVLLFGNTREGTPIPTQAIRMMTQRRTRPPTSAA